MEVTNKILYDVEKSAEMPRIFLIYAKINAKYAQNGGRYEAVKVQNKRPLPAAKAP